MRLEVLVAPYPPSSVSGRVLHLCEPMSFWGGISPLDGTLTDSRCEHYGETVSGRILFIRELRGSSSGSSVLLELAYKGIAPLAIVLPEADAIVTLSTLAAREMAWPAPGLFRLSVEQQQTVPGNVSLSITPDGRVDFQSSS
jgi:predicted aconitase with swiveling domain